MSDKLLIFGLFSLGLAAILIGISITIVGSHAVATFFQKALSNIFDVGSITDMATPNVESELRFYAVLFVFYGCILVQTASNIDLYAARIPILLAVLFFAGIARFVGYLAVGAPHLLFTILMIIELTLPILLFICLKIMKTEV